MTKFFQRRCRCCGEFEDSHHDFVPMPGHCQCLYLEWGDNITEPCSEFVPPPAVVGPRRDCVRCEHGEQCHAAYWAKKESP
jgi:hypothetical protein